MTSTPPRFDLEYVRRSWDFAADAYAQGQASGRDYYRYEFFGPEHVALCGEVEGLRVLDLGCGSGYFSREMAARGADVVGMDLSPRMIAHARKAEAAHPLGIQYVERDAADAGAALPGASFDLITSCMALQDMPDVPEVFRQSASLLEPGGRMVVSITHPCSDMPFREWARDEAGRKRWLCVDHYFRRGPLEYPWTGWGYDFTTPAIHATLGDWFGWFSAAGFALKTLREPEPSPEALTAYPDLEDAARIPYYLFFDLQLSTWEGR